jgi:Mn2+/Fe2+ NRAMP family transporter
MPLSTSYAICEAFGWESGISKNFREAPVFMGLFTLLLVIGALVVLSPSVPLFPLILLSQNVNGLLLPIVLVFILKLAGDRGLMGDQANSRVSQVIGVGTAVGASALSIALVAVTILGATP